eukprot:2979437-Prymnesium_polylepis.1
MGQRQEHQIGTCLRTCRLDTLGDPGKDARAEALRPKSVLLGDRRLRAQKSGTGRSRHHQEALDSHLITHLSCHVCLRRSRSHHIPSRPTAHCKSKSGS